jgi:hypothetical protein
MLCDLLEGVEETFDVIWGVEFGDAEQYGVFEVGEPGFEE